MKDNVGFDRQRDVVSWSPLTRRHILRSAAAGAGGALLSAAICRATGRAPTRPQSAPTGPLTRASLTVTSNQRGAIPPFFTGLSYEKTELTYPAFTGKNSDMIGLFRRLGPGVLRLGGHEVEMNVWTPHGKGGNQGQIAPRDIDALEEFLSATGWRCLYGVNLEGAARGETTPALAAAEVAYVARRLGPALLGIEIGNEPNLYGRPRMGFAGHWSFEQYLALWRQYRDAILALTPNVPMTGPATAGATTTWTLPFGRAIGKERLSLLTQHYYRGDGGSPSSTVESLVSPDPKLLHVLAQLKTGAASIGIPFRVAECNSFYNQSHAYECDSYASALWVIDFLFNCAQAGATGVNLHSIEISPGRPAGYAPIADWHGVVEEVRPEYYGMVLHTLVGHGTLVATQLAVPDDLNLTAYAVQKPSGGINLIVNNKDAKSHLSLDLEMPQTARSATLIELMQHSKGTSLPTLSANAGVAIQGARVEKNGSFNPHMPYTIPIHGKQIKCYVPALSAVLIQVA